MSKFDPTASPAQVIYVDALTEVFRLAGVGNTDEDGRVYLHLASEQRGEWCKNGWHPRFIADWFLPSEVDVWTEDEYWEWLASNEA